MANPTPRQIALDLDLASRPLSRDELRAKVLGLAKDMLVEDAAARNTNAEWATHGVTFDQVRIRAETRGWCTGEEADPKLMSFGAAVMKAAGGVPCEFRASKHRKSHGRMVRVFRLKSMLDAMEP